MQTKHSVKSILSIAILFLLFPMVVLLANQLGTRKYYVVSLLVVLLSILSLMLSFEKRKPQSREIIVIAVMSATAAAARTAFIFVPFFKPLAAVVILTGVSLGAQAGFVCGALSMLVSNFIFGQGPWTAWQMIAYGIVGLISGLIFYKKPQLQRIPILTVFGALIVVLVAGPILDLSTLFTITQGASSASILSVLLAGLSVNLIQAAATCLFMFILGKPILEKLDRMKIKYGLMEDR